MTCREKLAIDHPEQVGEEFMGGANNCPHTYGYREQPDYCHKLTGCCELCWDREMLEKPKGNLDIHAFWERTYAMIDDAMEKRNRSVSVFFHPENGISVSTYPWPDAETLWEMYQNGQITATDFRTKMGLPMVKNPEQFMKRGFLNKELHIPKE